MVVEMILINIVGLFIMKLEIILDYLVSFLDIYTGS